MPLPPESLPPYYMQGNAINNRVTHNDRPWLVLVNRAGPGNLHRTISGVSA